MNKNSSINTTLDMYIGPMYSGKSSELIKQARKLLAIKKKILVVKPKIDNRYYSDKISTHNLDSLDCTVVENISDINGLLDSIDYLLIDEGQFFSDLYKNVLFYLETKNINVKISGLVADSNRKKFGEILDLIPIATNVLKFNALCMECNDGTEGPFSKRLCKKNYNQTLVGTTDKYSAVCRYHYNLNNN